MTLSTNSLAESRVFCRQLARGAHSSFYPSFMVLPRPKRWAMEALYAFMRHTDDLSDSVQPRDAQRAALAAWRAAIQTALAGDAPFAEPCAANRSDNNDDALPSENAKTASGLSINVQILPALVDSVRRFGIDPAHLFAVLDGVEMDLDPRRFATFDELAEYCHRVASAVGLACLPVWGVHGDPTGPARQCGLAFQLTNILRDLREDADRGRLYLPLDEMQRCHYAESDLRAGVADSRFLDLMSIQIDRAERCFHDSIELFDLLHRDGQRIFGMMTNTYHAILHRIRKRPAAVLRSRVRLNWTAKLALAGRWILLPPRKAALP
jgi:phytoene synthase